MEKLVRPKRLYKAESERVHEAHRLKGEQGSERMCVRTVQCTEAMKALKREDESIEMSREAVGVAQ